MEDNKQIKPEISFDDYMKADVRMCQITSVEKVEGADKLYKLQIDTGIDSRVVVSAIAHKVTPEQLQDKIMPFVLNLTPRKIRNIDSFGMIIMAGDCLPVHSDQASKGDVVI